MGTHRRPLPLAFETLALTLLRVAVGVVVVNHGAGKLLELDAFSANLEGWSIPFADVSAMTLGVIETICGVGLVLGMSTAAASVVALLTLLITVAVVEPATAFAFTQSEQPTLLALAMLYFASRGPGELSMDAVSNRSSHMVAGYPAVPPVMHDLSIPPPPKFGNWHWWRRGGEGFHDEELSVLNDDGPRTTTA